MKAIIIALLLSATTYICHGINYDGYIVATAFDRYEWAAYNKVADVCHRQRLGCARIMCGIM